MSILRDYIYPIVSGVIIGVIGGIYGLEWLWTSILIAVPIAMLSRTIKAGVLNASASSLAVFLAPMFISMSTDPRVFRMLDTLSTIAGVGWIVIVIISIAAYTAVSVLACIAIVSIKRIFAPHSSEGGF